MRVVFMSTFFRIFQLAVGVGVAISLGHNTTRPPHHTHMHRLLYTPPPNAPPFSLVQQQCELTMCMHYSWRDHDSCGAVLFEKLQCGGRDNSMPAMALGTNIYDSRHARGNDLFRVGPVSLLGANVLNPGRNERKKRPPGVWGPQGSTRQMSMLSIPKCCPLTACPVSYRRHFHVRIDGCLIGMSGWKM